MVASAVIGLGLGVLMGLRRGAEWLGAPVFIVLQAAPVAALIPLVTFIYGIGLVAKSLSVMLLALPVIVLNCYKAVRNVNPSLVDMCRSFQGTRAQQIAKIVIPDASPVIFAGLRLGVAAGFIGVVLAELLITPDGHRRSHHLSPGGGRLCGDVCVDRLDHPVLGADPGAAAAA